MSITFSINKEFNGIEIKFSEKPSPAILKKLKELGFRWHSYKCVWFAKNTEERLAFAKSIQDENTYSQVSLFAEEQNKIVDEPKAEPKKVEPKTKKAEKVEKVTKEKAKRTATIKAVTEQKAEPKTEHKTEPKAEKKSNIIVFPTKERPVVNMVIREGNHSVEECVEKLTTECNEVFKGSFSETVFNGILAMCDVSQNFRNNVMDESKTLLGAFEYCEKLARNGYAFKYGNTVFMNDNFMLGMAIDYFNSEDSLAEVEALLEKGN